MNKVLNFCKQSVNDTNVVISTKYAKRSVGLTVAMGWVKLIYFVLSQAGLGP